MHILCFNIHGEPRPLQVYTDDENRCRACCCIRVIYNCHNILCTRVCIRVRCILMCINYQLSWPSRVHTRYTRLVSTAPSTFPRRAVSSKSRCDWKWTKGRSSNRPRLNSKGAEPFFFFSTIGDFCR